MANLFEETPPEESSLFGTEPVVRAPQFTTHQKYTTSLLGAMAKQWNTTSEQSLADLMALVDDRLDRGEEDKLRSEIDEEQKSRTIQTLSAMELEALKQGEVDVENKLSLKSLINREIALSTREPNPMALEEEGVSNIQVVGTEDPAQAATFEENGDALDIAAEEAAKIQYFNRLLDEENKKLQDQGWVSDVLDFLVFPGQSYISQRAGNVPGATALLPGANLAQQVEALGSMSLEEYKKVLPEVINRIRAYSGLFTENQGIVVEALRRMSPISDWSTQMEANFQAGLEAATIIPWSATARASRNAFTVMQQVGNRNMAAKMAASAVQKDAMDLPDRVAGGFGRVTDPDAGGFEATLPSSSKVETMDLVTPYVGVNGDVYTEIKAMNDVAKNIPRAAVQVTEQATLRAYIEEHIKRVYNRIRRSGEDIADIHRNNVAELQVENIVGRMDPEALSTVRGRIAQEYIPEEGEPSARSIIPGVGRISPVIKELKDKLEIHQDSDTGLVSLSFYLGNGARQGGYLTRELAEEGAKKRGLANYKVVNSHGQYYVRVDEIVPETGSVEPVHTADTLPAVNTFSQWWRNPQQALPDRINEARLAAVLDRGTVEHEVFQPLVQKINALGRKELNRHNKIVRKGQDEQKWYNVDELVVNYENEFGRAPSDKEIIAYYAHKDIVDATDDLIDDFLYTSKARAGWKTGQITNTLRQDLIKGMLLDRENVGFNTPLMNMREIEAPDWSNTRIFDFDENITLHPGEGPGNKAIRDRAVDKWNTGNYRLIELEEEVMHNGDPVKFVLVHKSSNKIGPLERRQRKRVGGGRTENLNKHFVVQARKGSFRGTDKAYVLNPVVHLSESTATKAKARALQLEEARQAYINPSITPNEKRIAVERAVESMEKWEEMIKDGTIQPNQPFRYVYDREQPPEMLNLPDGTERWNSREYTGSDHYYSSRRQLYYQQDRDMLLDSSENITRNLDPNKVLGRAINSALNTRAFSNYNAKVIEDWARMIPKGAIAESSVGYSKDPYEIFFHGRFTDQFMNSPQTAGLYQKLEANRRIHNRFIGYRNGEMTMRDLFNRRVASWIDGKGTTREWAATKFYDSLSRNPTDAVQGFVFDAYLGFYNPDQFFLQAQTAVLAMTVHPLRGAQSTAMLPWMTHMLLNRSDNLLDMYAKNLRHIHGLDVDEFKTMVRELRKSGWMKVQGSALQLDYLTNRVGGSTIGRLGGKFRRGGRAIFNLAERYNRLTGFQLAWYDVKKQFPGLTPGSPEFMGKVRSMTDALTMNMTAASKTGWQQGVWAVPTKFLGYQAHVLENVLPKNFGGSTKLRASQKARLALAQLGMYGVGGAVGAYSIADWMHDSYEMATGRKMDEATYRAISKGFIDSMIATWSDEGLDTDFSSRAGVGAGMASWFEKIASGDLASTVDILGGATASWGNNFIDAANRISWYLQSAQIHEITAEEWGLVSNDLLSTIKSWNRVSQAYAIYMTGRLKDPKTGQSILKAGEMDHIAAFFGIPLAAQTEFWREQRKLNNRKQIIQDFAKEIAQTRRLGFEAMAKGDMKAAHSYADAEGRLFDLVKEDYRMHRDVVAEVKQLLNYNDDNWATLQQRVMESFGREPVAGRRY